MNQHIILSDETGTSRIATTEGLGFTPLDFSGWYGAGVEGAGLFMFVFDIESDAVEYPLHASEDEWLAYVIEGSGELFSGNPDGEKLDGVKYSAGDTIAFGANTQHAWKNGGKKGKILFVKQA